MSSKSKAKKKLFKGFAVLPVTLTKSGSGTQYLYYKKQNGQDSALFVANVPFNWNPEDVGQVFSCFGEVEGSCFLVPETGDLSFAGAKRALITFTSEEDLNRALTTDLSKTRQPFQSGSLPSGMQKWLEEYASLRPPADKLQIQVDRFMEAFDQRGSKKAAVVDEEGWTTVTGSAKRRRVLLPKGVALPEKKKQKGVILNFYKHQDREQKQSQLVELRRKFEEDKAKLARLKASRKGLLESSFTAAVS